jgi:hypothetical protein
MYIALNGIDITGMLVQTSIDIDAEKVEGKNSGTSMGGTKIVDLVDVKNVISAKTGLLTPAQYKTLRTMGNQAYITATFKPDEDTTTTCVMIPTFGAARSVENMSIKLREQ